MNDGRGLRHRPWSSTRSLRSTMYPSTNRTRKAYGDAGQWRPMLDKEGQWECQHQIYNDSLVVVLSYVLDIFGTLFRRCQTQDALCFFYHSYLLRKGWAYNTVLLQCLMACSRACSAQKWCYCTRYQWNLFHSVSKQERWALSTILIY